MSQPVKTLIAGNWKMNGLKASLGELEQLKALVGAGPLACDIAVCVPFTLVASAATAMAGSPVAIGGQDCHTQISGAHTGDISAAMLADAGAAFIIVGHSERRADHGETDANVRAKAEAVIAAGLTPIICVGETEAERRAGSALAVVESQLAASVPDSAGTSKIVIAYEPVWAIGTGLTPTRADIAEIHAAIRAQLVARFGDAGAGIAILYGGSMKPGNAAEILGVDDVNGGLVGGASLKAEDFNGIIQAA